MNFATMFGPRKFVRALWIFAAVAVLSVAGCCPCYHNLSEYKADLRNYYKNDYYAQIDHKVKQAEKYLRDRPAVPGEKTAVVFDIDETALSNWRNMTDLDLGYNGKLWDEWAEQEQATAIPPVLRLYNEVIAGHTAAFFITGRNERLRSATEGNLKLAGYSGWSALYLRPNDGTNSVGEYKKAMREEIQKNGYTIIINIGDQWSDLQGGVSEKSFKLPNPFYTVK